MEKLDRITINPTICLGQPTIRGMRITVGFVLKLLASNLSIQEIVDDRQFALIAEVPHLQKPPKPFSEVGSSDFGSD